MIDRWQIDRGIHTYTQTHTIYTHTTYTHNLLVLFPWITLANKHTIKFIFITFSKWWNHRTEQISGCHSLGLSKVKREVGVAIKGNTRLWRWECFYLDCIDIKILAIVWYYSLTSCYIKGNWVKGIWDTTVLFLKTARESIIISESLIFKKWNKIYLFSLYYCGLPWGLGNELRLSLRWIKHSVPIILNGITAIPV